MRFGAFAGVFLVLAALEMLAPDRPDPADRPRRWRTNLALGLLGAGLARALGPLTAMGASFAAQDAGFGLFNAAPAPGAVVAVVCFAALDLSLYMQHRLLHAVPLLWRAHAPHHADRMLDVTTGLRFHPLEYLGSMVWKAAIAALLGAPVWVVAVFEVALNAFSMFTHANVRLPEPLQRALGLVLVTPRAHRLHHDRDAGRASGNYGFSINLWDRLFGTWRIGPEPAHLGIEGGAADPAKLGATLAQPLR